MTYDRAYWDQLWAKTLREHRDMVAQRIQMRSNVPVA
jgi:hypothetical protein